MGVDYLFYREIYGGSTVPELSWMKLSGMACARLMYFTFGRLKEEFPDEAKLAVCEMAEAMFENEKHSGKTAENNDGYSVSYDVDASKAINARLLRIAETYLAGTGLLYLGVCDE